MRGTLLLFAPLLALGGCDSGGSSEPTQVKSIQVGAANPYHERMQQLSDADRGLALRRALQDSGQRCRRPIASAFQGDYKALKMWTLRCPDTGDWAIFLAATGDVQVRSCRDLTELGLPPCVVTALEPRAAD